MTMKAIIRVAAIAALAATMLASSSRAAPKNEDDADKPFPLWVTLQGGGMFPAGSEGAGIETGYQLVGTLESEMGSFFVAGADIGYVSSGDDYRTRIVWLGGHARLVPNRDLGSFFVQGGAGLYHIGYHPEPPLVAPSGLMRPGLSFVVGYDVKEFGWLTVGVQGSYHGIVLHKSDALSFLTLGIHVSRRPPGW